MAQPKSAFRNQRDRYPNLAAPYDNKPTFDPDDPDDGTPPRGGMPSVKTGRTVGFWDLREHAAIVLFETTPEVLWYEERPERIRFRDDTEWLTYVPSFSVRTEGGYSMVELSTCGKPRGVREQTVAEFARAYYAARGIRYVELSHALVAAVPRATRAYGILRYLSVKVPDADVLKATDVLLRGPAPIDHVEREAGVSHQRLIAMACRGILRLHGDGPVRRDTVIGLPGQERAQ
nr:hypothetical protein [uncultured Rhodopila sp.]